MSPRLLALLLTAAAVAAIAATVPSLRPDYAGVRAGREDAGYLASTDCRKCHEPAYASWRATFHRTMTREATVEDVKGDFERDNVLEYQGVRAQMTREAGRYWMNLRDQQGRTQQLEIVRTVGSRRIQQYLTKQEDRWMRLPVAYDLVQKRWMHLNGSFFHADGAGFTQHVAEWNSNCVFCHNVKAQPGLDWDKRVWNTEVAELGIACGACHGPTGQHAQKALDPATRYRWHLSPPSAAEVAVVHPGKLDSDRSMQVCAHCHGQRIPEPQDRIREIMTKGDPYDAGEDLRSFYKPVQAGLKLGPVDFSTRFWADGSPRLTAYEYQALTRSKCFTAGEPGQRITCISCHSMHGGDPRGQLTESMKTNAACTQCHTALVAPAKLTEHTRHSAGSAGSQCVECHMPKIVYGVMSAHRTHDISNPQPTETARFGKPNACNQCHTDWSVNKAIAETKRLWPAKYGASEAAGPAFDEPEGARALFAGDAVLRALTASALAPTARRDAPLLLEALEDKYPIVRYFAANALQQIEPTLPKPDYLASAATRAVTLREWLAKFDADAQRAAREKRQRLEKQRSEVDVEVGE